MVVCGAGVVAGQVKRAERDSQEGGAGDQDRRLHAHQRDQQEGQVPAATARGEGPTLTPPVWVKPSPSMVLGGAEESACGREVGTMEHRRNDMDPK